MSFIVFLFMFIGLVCSSPTKRQIQDDCMDFTEDALDGDFESTENDKVDGAALFIHLEDKFNEKLWNSIQEYVPASVDQVRKVFLQNSLVNLEKQTHVWFVSDETFNKAKDDLGVPFADPLGISYCQDANSAHVMVIDSLYNAEQDKNEKDVAIGLFSSLYINTVIHEFVHAVQAEIGFVLREEAYWLIEGSAEAIAHELLPLVVPIAASTDFRSLHFSALRHRCETLPTFRGMQKFDEFYEAGGQDTSVVYEMAHSALMLLAQTHADGKLVEALVELIAIVKSDEDVDNAFESLFDVSRGTFESDLYVAQLQAFFDAEQQTDIELEIELADRNNATLYVARYLNEGVRFFAFNVEEFPEDLKSFRATIPASATGVLVTEPADLPTREQMQPVDAPMQQQLADSTGCDNPTGLLRVVLESTDAVAGVVMAEAQIHLINGVPLFVEPIVRVSMQGAHSLPLREVADYSANELDYADGNFRVSVRGQDVTFLPEKDGSLRSATTSGSGISFIKLLVIAILIVFTAYCFIGCALNMKNNDKDFGLAAMPHKDMWKKIFTCNGVLSKSSFAKSALPRNYIIIIKYIQRRKIK